MVTAIDYPDQSLLSFAIAGTLSKAGYATVVPALDAKVPPIFRAR